MKKRLIVLLLCLCVCLPAFGCSVKMDGTVIVPADTLTPLPETGGNEEDKSPEQPDFGQSPGTNTSPAPQEPVAPTPPTERYDTLISSTVNGLYVRTGRGTGYESMGTLDKDDMAMPIGLHDGWYAIRYKNSVGYVSAAYVQTVSFEKSSDTVEKVIDAGKSLLGLPYVYGAPRYHWGNGVKNPEFTGQSYDCSSLTQYMYKIGAGIDIATTSREQSVQGRNVPRSEIRRGDLLFFTNAQRYNNSGLDRIGHVALYLGNNYVLHTASDHAVIEPISARRHNYYISAGRFV